MKTFKSHKFVLLFLCMMGAVYAENYKPYIMAFTSTESIEVIKDSLTAQLTANEINVLGAYQPAEDKNRWVLAIGSHDLDLAVTQLRGLTGFASVLRVGITSENGSTVVSYANPIYWGNAYFKTDFYKVADNYHALNEKLQNAMYATGGFVGYGFGSEKGLSAERLQTYRYMLGMPSFQNTVKLKEFETHQDAVVKIEANFITGIKDLELVYKHHIPDTKLTLFGVGLKGERGESHFLPIIDIADPKYTAFLPYEILVIDNEVHMLHGRFRIALSFPDLTMGTFTKILSTPGDIEDAFKRLVE